MPDGGWGNDRLLAGAGANRLAGGGGDDLLRGGADGDELIGGTGQDTASYAGAAKGVRASFLNASANTNDAAGDSFWGIERLVGTAFGDTLIGANGANRLTGGRGADQLMGRGGADVLVGGWGADEFIFNTALGEADLDVIKDFTSSLDEIRLDDAIFSVFDPGDIGQGLFRANASGAAKDADDRLLYETDTGLLRYDADGDGAGLAVAFAELAGSPALAYTDLTVF